MNLFFVDSDTCPPFCLFLNEAELQRKLDEWALEAGIRHEKDKKLREEQHQLYRDRLEADKRRQEEMSKS